MTEQEYIDIQFATRIRSSYDCLKDVHCFADMQKIVNPEKFKEVVRLTSELIEEQFGNINIEEEKKS